MQSEYQLSVIGIIKEWLYQNLLDLSCVPNKVDSKMILKGFFF